MNVNIRTRLIDHRYDVRRRVQLVRMCVRVQRGWARERGAGPRSGSGSGPPTHPGGGSASSGSSMSQLLTNNFKAFHGCLLFCFVLKQFYVLILIDQFKFE